MRDIKNLQECKLSLIEERARSRVTFILSLPPEMLERRVGVIGKNALESALGLVLELRAPSPAGHPPPTQAPIDRRHDKGGHRDARDGDDRVDLFSGRHCRSSQRGPRRRKNCAHAWSPTLGRPWERPRKHKKRRGRDADFLFCNYI